jgi:aromatic ring-opening dioxygenase catalytic subunit (LigB family)
MRAFFAPDSAEIREANSAFQEWLEDTCTNSELTEEERQQRLINWASAPHARFCHPREEHLLPLHVCAGMAGRAADQHIATEILNKASGMYYWQGQQRNHIG